MPSIQYRPRAALRYPSVSRHTDRDTAQPGDTLHPDDTPGARGPACYADDGRHVCTLHDGHGGPQHVATTFGNKVTATWPTEFTA